MSPKPNNTSGIKSSLYSTNMKYSPGIKSYEQTQETMALLKMLALGQRQIEEGKVQPAGDVVAKLRNRSKTR